MSNRNYIQWHRARRSRTVWHLRFPWNRPLLRPPMVTYEARIPRNLICQRRLWKWMAGRWKILLEGRGWPVFSGAMSAAMSVSWRVYKSCVYKYIYTQNCISGSSSEFASPRVVNYIDRCPVSLSVVTLSHLDLYLIHWRKWANKTIYTQKSQWSALPCNNPT